MALSELEPLLDAITEWATARYLPLHEGRLVLGDALPSVTVLARVPDDVHTFFALAASLDRPTVVLDAVTSDEGTVAGFAGAPAQAGTLRRLTAYVFASGMGRAVVLEARADGRAAGLTSP